MLEKLNKLVGSVYYFVFMIMLLIIPFFMDIGDSKVYVIGVAFALFFIKVIIQGLALKLKSKDS